MVDFVLNKCYIHADLILVLTKSGMAMHSTVMLIYLNGFACLVFVNLIVECRCVCVERLAYFTRLHIYPFFFQLD